MCLTRARALLSVAAYRAKFALFPKSWETQTLNPNPNFQKEERDVTCEISRYKKKVSFLARAGGGELLLLSFYRREREKNGGRVDATAETADRGERFVGFDRE